MRVRTPVDRAEKKELVSSLNTVFSNAGVVVVAQYSGLTVAQMQVLRKEAKAAGATVQVAKNRLAKIALNGTDVASVSPLLKGPTLLAYSKDPVAALKVITEFAKKNDKFLIFSISGSQKPRRFPPVFLLTLYEIIEIYSSYRKIRALCGANSAIF